MERVDFYDELETLEDRISCVSLESLSLENIHKVCKKDAKFLLLPQSQEIVMKEINGYVAKAVDRDKNFLENNEFIKSFNKILRYLAAACNSLYIWNLKSKVSEQIIVNVNSILLAERWCFETPVINDCFWKDLSFFTSVLNNQIVDLNYEEYSKNFGWSMGQNMRIF